MPARPADTAPPTDLTALAAGLAAWARRAVAARRAEELAWLRAIEQPALVEATIEVFEDAFVVRAERFASPLRYHLVVVGHGGRIARIVLADNQLRSEAAFRAACERRGGFSPAVRPGYRRKAFWRFADMVRELARCEGA